MEESSEYHRVVEEKTRIERILNMKQIADERVVSSEKIERQELPVVEAVPQIQVSNNNQFAVPLVVSPAVPAVRRSRTRRKECQVM